MERTWTETLLEDDVWEKAWKTLTELGEVGDGVAAVGKKSRLDDAESFVEGRTTHSVPPRHRNGARNGTTETYDDAVLLLCHTLFCPVPQREGLKVLRVLKTVLQETDAVVLLLDRRVAPRDPVVEPADAVGRAAVTAIVKQATLLDQRGLFCVLIQL